MVKAKKFILSKHFVGFPEVTDIQIVQEDLPSLKNGEFLAQAVFLSVDPYIRQFEPDVEVGSVIQGSQVALITESRSKEFPVGKYVVAYFGWRTHTISDGSETIKGFGHPEIVPDIGGLSLSLALGVLGMPGNTAYFGFLEICQPKFGETVVVTSAAGAVGSHVGQIAKIRGCKVIGVTGEDEKGQWLVNELGFDHFINYKKPNFAQALSEVAPNGIDCYFDNVGGEISSIILKQMNNKGRISVCGSIASYDSESTNFPKATMIQRYLYTKLLKMEGFVVFSWRKRWLEGIQQNLKWIREGKLKYKETVTEGFENTFEAFTGMLQGHNKGKSIVKV